MSKLDANATNLETLRSLLQAEPKPDLRFRLAYDDRQKSFSDETAIDFSHDPDDAEYHPSRSLTVQADSHDLDINTIVAKFVKTGVVPSSRLEPFFGDASALPDFQTAQQILIDARLAFESLPALTRDYFYNDPERMLEFLGDDKNYDEAKRLGLVTTREALEPDTRAPLPEGDAKRPQKAGEAAPDTVRQDGKKES